MSTLSIEGVGRTFPPVHGGTPTLEQYWEDGPEFTGWGEVVGKYPDGTPAIVEGFSSGGGRRPCAFGSLLDRHCCESPASGSTRADSASSARSENPGCSCARVR